ncbi:hypothetical protein HVIM_03979 [Roseomonas mucosa]|nr:hypothetical protein HVIM_03979 [Roseomonas mucosa]UZO90449.1 Hypothetical protein RMP42_03979 [Roseomonas mucosa]
MPAVPVLLRGSSDGVGGSRCAASCVWSGKAEAVRPGRRVRRRRPDLPDRHVASVAIHATPGRTGGEDASQEAS